MKFVVYKVNSIINSEEEIQPPPELYESQRIAFGVRPLGIPPKDKIIGENISFFN